ncbi:Thioredoxin-Like Protein 4A [Manis pentadactyla]|nr:Thioredoxin-Like Protein 4A [Manis pentadactyla]
MASRLPSPAAIASCFAHSHTQESQGTGFLSKMKWGKQSKREEIRRQVAARTLEAVEVWMKRSNEQKRLTVRWHFLRRGFSKPWQRTLSQSEWMLYVTNIL